jgi:16S rRNA (uracil1498-N3)-methyltransferase
MKPGPTARLQTARFILKDSLSHIKDPAQLHQITKVLRLQPGSNLIGIWQEKQYLIRLGEFKSKKEIELIVVQELREEPGQELSYNLKICLPLLKGEKLDWTIQKCTELGATHFQFVYFQHSIKQSLNFAHKLERWQKIAAEAVEQSERLKTPIFLEPVSVEDLILTEDEEGLVFLERSFDGAQKRMSFNKSQNKNLIFGPEGGFSETEKLLLLQKGFRSVSLGRRILRSETAIIAGVSLVTLKDF